MLTIISEVTEEIVKETSPPTRSGTPPKPQPQELLPSNLLERREDCVAEVIEKAEVIENKMEDIPASKLPNREGNPNHD